MDVVEEAKVCGWCQTNETTQWRFGPSGCSKSKLLYIFAYILHNFLFINSFILLRNDDVVQCVRNQLQKGGQERGQVHRPRSAFARYLVFETIHPEVHKETT